MLVARSDPRCRNLTHPRDGRCPSAVSYGASFAIPFAQAPGAMGRSHGMLADPRADTDIVVGIM